MAVVTDLMQSYDQSAVADIEVAEGIHMISPTDTPLQLMLPKIQVGEVKSEWIEDQLTSQVTALAEALDNSETEVDITSGDGALKFPSNAQLGTYNVVVRVDEEYMLVTGISTDTLTVTRGYSDSDAATHNNLAVMHIISQLETEGADGKAAWAQVRTRPSNYVQTFSRTVEVSGIQEAIKTLGGITSEMDYQILQAKRQLALELEKTIIMGVAAAAGSASVPRTMAGLWSLVSSNVTEDSGSIDTDAIEGDIQTIWDAGGVPRAIVTTGTLAQAIANLYADRIRTDVQTTVGGANITSIINPLGEGPIAIIPHRMMLAGSYYMLDTSRIGLGYLRPFFMKDLADDGDADKRWIGGDYTLHLMNETAHARRYGLS